MLNLILTVGKNAKLARYWRLPAALNYAALNEIWSGCGRLGGWVMGGFFGSPTRKFVGLHTELIVGRGIATISNVFSQSQSFPLPLCGHLIFHIPFGSIRVWRTDLMCARPLMKLSSHFAHGTKSRYTSVYVLIRKTYDVWTFTISDGIPWIDQAISNCVNTNFSSSLFLFWYIRLGNMAAGS